MISSVTTATVSTVTTATLAGSFGLIVVVTLLLLLIKKEIISTSNYPWAKTLSRILNIVIVPLVMVFVFLVVAQIGSTMP